VPASDVARKAFGIVDARDPTVFQFGPPFDQAVVGVSMIGLLPDFISFRVTIATRL
jgi:hypothetical protein